MTATLGPSERVFNHAGKLYSAKCANLGVGKFAIPFAYENESTFGLELNLDYSYFELCKCHSNFNSIYVFRNSANSNSNSNL